MRVSGMPSGAEASMQTPFADTFDAARYARCAGISFARLAYGVSGLLAAHAKAAQQTVTNWCFFASGPGRTVVGRVPVSRAYDHPAVSGFVALHSSLHGSS